MAASSNLPSSKSGYLHGRNAVIFEVDSMIKNTPLTDLVSAITGIS